MRLAAGRFAFTVRLGFCFGATMMIGGRVVADGAAVDGAVVQGDGSVLCAHTLQGNSNKATLTHSRLMDFPRRRVHVGASQFQQLPIRYMLSPLVGPPRQ